MSLPAVLFLPATLRRLPAEHESIPHSIESHGSSNLQRCSSNSHSYLWGCWHVRCSVLIALVASCSLQVRCSLRSLQRVKLFVRFRFDLNIWSASPQSQKAFAQSAASSRNERCVCCAQHTARHTLSHTLVVHACTARSVIVQPCFESVSFCGCVEMPLSGESLEAFGG